MKYSIAMLVVSGALVLTGCAPQDAPTTPETVTPSPALDDTSSPAPDDEWGDPLEGTVVEADNLAAQLPGFWTGDWGDIVFRIEEDDTVVAAYAYDEGIIVGRLEGAVMKGWWCEVPSRLPDGDAGDVEMRLVEGTDGTHIDGRWSYGVAAHDTWSESWDIDALSDQEPPAELVARLDEATALCVPPAG